jgi:hypothetical protein
MKDVPDRELTDFIRDLRLQIVALEAQIEPPAASRQRTVRLIRGTFLTVGGFLTATFNPLGIALVLVGGWDWVDAVVDDVAAMNRRLALRRAIMIHSRQLAAAEVEFHRRRNA